MGVTLAGNLGLGKDGMGRRERARSVVWMTGTSPGIGRACADLLAREGFAVHGASLSVPVGGAEGWIPMRLDVQDGEAVRRAVDRILAEAGRLDAVVNNAGGDRRSRGEHPA